MAAHDRVNCMEMTEDILNNCNLHLGGLLKEPSSFSSRKISQLLSFFMVKLCDCMKSCPTTGRNVAAFEQFSFVPMV